jgi:probable addiction module antidote protein
MTSDGSFAPKRGYNNPTAIAQYLTEVFEKNDLTGILNAFKFVMHAQNVKALAETTGMRRDGLYKTFNGKKDPQLSRVLGMLEGLDVRIVVKPLPPKKKPPRPKLGRPPKSPTDTSARKQ